VDRCPVAVAFAGFTHAQDSLDPKSRQELKRADLTGTNMEVIISVIENQPGETIERHIRHGEEAFYVLEGATLETADGKQITLPTGASAINRRDVPHAGLKSEIRHSNIWRSISWTRAPSCTTRLRSNDQRSPGLSACL